jgi:NAD(P)-dependent dehydrogenase (short-subunit alcohol dehydrogenase family)
MSDSRRFAGAIALVTGGASGIGRAIAERIAREGADVSILDKNGKSADSVAAQIRQGGQKSIAIEADITDADRVEHAVSQAIDALGPISVLVNNAGGVTGQTFDDTDAGRWRADIELNLNGAYFVARAVVPSMLLRGGGAIVNVATVNGLTTIAEPAYSAAKAGLLQFTRQLAVEYGPKGIRTNAVVPGSIRTPLWDHRVAKTPHLLNVLRRWYPVGRLGEPEDVAAAVLFLASAEAGFINGANLLVDGGLMAGLPQMTRDILMTAQSESGN